MIQNFKILILLSTAIFTTGMVYPESSAAQTEKREIVTTTTTVAPTTTTSTTAPPTTTTTWRPKVTTPPVTSPLEQISDGDFRSWVLGCIAKHEGSPAYDNGIGTAKLYRGRYQFSQRSWDDVARAYGYDWLAGKDVATATAQEQDDMAWVYYEHSKYGPWPPSQGVCP